jgi:hypothetical protein
MGECGCGNAAFESAFRVRGQNPVLGIERYAGCRDCGTGPAVRVSVFDRKGATEWLVGLPSKDLIPDANGSNSGRGIGIMLWEPEDLIAAAGEIEAAEGTVGPEPNDYESVADWLSDYGHALVSRAMEIAHAREREEAPCD